MNNFVDVADNVFGQVYTYQVSTTGDCENNDPSSLFGNDLVLFDAQPADEQVSLPPPVLSFAPIGNGAYGFMGAGVPAHTDILQATSDLSPVRLGLQLRPTPPI